MYAKATKQKAEPEIPADIPQTELNGVEAEPVAVASAEPQPEPAPEAVAQAEAEAAKADEAKFALLRQIESMKRAEQQQRLQYERVQLANLTREEKLEAWQAQGLTEREASFLREHPLMLDYPEIVSFAANEAVAAGAERNSDSYWKAVEVNFDRAMSHMRAQAEAREPTPRFFEPPPAPAPRRPSVAGIVSAPVSREVPDGRPKQETNPERMATTLSIAEQEVARASGISLTEYARQKLKMQAQVRSGERQA